MRLTLMLVLLVVAGTARAAVTFQAAGTALAGTNVIGGLAVTWPAHVQGDVALLFVESRGEEAVTLLQANGFAAVANTPQSTGTLLVGTRLTVFWARATSAAMLPPIITTPTDHVYARIITYRGVLDNGNPIDATAGGVKAVASTSVTVTGVTTTVANTLIVQAVARHNDNAAAAFSAQANVNLTGIAEQLDAGTANGDGGGLGVWSGTKATAGATGNTTATVTSSINAFVTIALKPQPGPRFQAAGAAVGNASTASPAWPAHAINDIALLFVESGGGEVVTLSVAAGFAPVLNSPQATGLTTAGTRLTVFWARATSAAMTAPTVTVPVVANSHLYAQIITFRGVITAGDPWDVTGGGFKTPASTALSVTGVTTTVVDTLLVQAAARDWDNAGAFAGPQANVNLTGIAERVDAGTATGLGGGFAIWDGYKATAGATGNTTATVTSSINAFLSIALRPQAATVPVFSALGTAVVAVAPLLAWPAHAVDDIALLFVESTGGQAVTLLQANGFAAVTNSPQFTGAGTAGTRISVFWARATSASMMGPILGGTTDHIYAQILTYRGVVNSGNPWDITGGGVKAVASTTVTVTGVTTTVANAMVVQAVARDNDNAAVAFSAQANINLSGIAERVDVGTTTGNGGGFSVWDGTKVAAGATGNTTATVTSSINAFLSVALKPAGAVAPDHYEMSLATDSVSCVTTTVTVTACADASSPCTSNYTAASGTNATLATSAGTLGTTSVTFNASGVATTTLNYAAAADGASAIVTLSGEAIAATNPRKCCPNGVGCAVGNTCTTTFKTAGFIFADTVGGTTATVPTQVAGTASASLYLRAVKTSTTTLACEAALSGGNAVNLGYTCSNPASCSAGSLLDITPYNLVDAAQPVVSVPPGAGAVTLYFDAGANAKLLFNYRDAGRIQVNASKAAGGSLLTALSGSSNAFVTKPWGFSLLATCADATGNAANQTTPGTGDPKFCRAGQTFNATATAITQAGSATPHYGKETVAETASATWTRQLPAAGANGTLPSGSMPFAGSGGVFGPPGIPFVWDEVGILKAVLAVGDGDYLGAGNVSSTAYVGRFYPDHFDVEIIPQLGCSGFVYAGRAGAPATLGQPFTVKATAKNGVGSPATTTNYNTTGGFSKNVDLTLTTGGTGVGNIYVDATAGGTGAIPASKFVAGVGQVNYNDVSGKISYVFDTYPTSTTITLRADDAESAISPMVAGASVPASARSGRLRLLNKSGPATLALAIPAETQYYSGSFWTINSLDSCSTTGWTVSPAGANALQGTGASGSTTGTLGGGVASGVVTFSASAPGSVGFGYLDFSVTVPDYLKFPWTSGAAVIPGARATFGVQRIDRRNNRTIDYRESY